MIEVTLERLRTYRANIVRYKRLLATRLTDLERAYIERRLNEEQASVNALLKEAFPERLCARWAKKNTRLTTNLDIADLLHPTAAFSHPMDVVYEKRAILSSWAADACAVKDVSELNLSIEGAVSFDDIVDALGVLDSQPWRTAKSDRASERHSDAQGPKDAPPL
jgi:hypothetical protein